MKLAAERAARRLAPGEAAARLEALKAPAALPAQPELKPEARLEALEAKLNGVKAETDDRRATNTHETTTDTTFKRRPCTSPCACACACHSTQHFRV